MVDLFATYCSANKRPDSGDLPAIDRYISDRIHGVYANAKSRGSQFAILSGRFGLLTPDHPIPDYDHLLQPSEIPSMVNQVAQTLTQWGTGLVRWHSVAFEMDPHVSRYSDVMRMAAEQNAIEFELELWEPTGMLGLV